MLATVDRMTRAVQSDAGGQKAATAVLAGEGRQQKDRRHPFARRERPGAQHLFMAALGTIQRATHRVVRSEPATGAVISHSLIDSGCPAICQAKRRKQPHTRDVSAALHRLRATWEISAERERRGRLSEIRREDLPAVPRGDSALRWWLGEIPG